MIQGLLEGELEDENSVTVSMTTTKRKPIIVGMATVRKLFVHLQEILNLIK